MKHATLMTIIVAEVMIQSATDTVAQARSAIDNAHRGARRLAASARNAGAGTVHLRPTDNGDLRLLRNAIRRAEYHSKQIQTQAAAANAARVVVERLIERI